MAPVNAFVMTGHFVYTPEKNAFSVMENGFLVCTDGKVEGLYSALPERFRSLPVHDYTGCIVIPGLCDTHVHAPQYAYRGLGMDLELIDWLNSHAFPEELKYASLHYAQQAYSQFVTALVHSATTRACVFATSHLPATLSLMRILEKSGIFGFAGMVNMDRNAPEGLCSSSASEALEVTEEWIAQALAECVHIRPILTPRFIPSCSDALMKGLGELQKKYNLPVQSHLSENLDEVAWVKELCPETSCYADAYARFGLMGCSAPTVMAHCVHPTEIEMNLLKELDVLVSHCPGSNANLCSGVAPVRRYLDAGIRVGLGSDVAGGFELSLFRAMTDAVQFSKLRARFVSMSEKPLTLPEAFYMGTKGGGVLFGRVGSFEAGYEFDAVVLDDSGLVSPGPLTVQERLERAVYLEKDVVIRQKYIHGSPMLGGATP